MPGSGRTSTRPWTDAESEGLTALAARHDIDASVLLELIGARAVDVHLNGESSWEGVPSNVWAYELGGHQVLKKWLSYREADLFGRSLTGDEVLHFSRIVRRITEVLCMGPKLDAAHATCRLTANAP